jgi:hypothetical protein
MIEFDLGEYVRVEHVRIYGDEELANIDGNNVNLAMNVQLLTAGRPITENILDNYVFLEGHPSIVWNSGFSYLDTVRDWRGKTFSSSNDIEVIFDNASMTKLMKVDRTDTNLLRPGDTTRFLFLRAQFTSDSIQKSGAIDQKTPAGWETFVYDFTLNIYFFLMHSTCEKLSFSGAPSAFLTSADPDVLSIKNAIGWSHIPQALKDAEDVVMNLYRRLESTIDYMTNGLAPGLAAEITAIQNAIGFANLPTG